MFAVRRAMTFRFDLCIIAMKKVRLYAVLNAVNVISLSLNVVCDARLFSILICLLDDV